MWRIKYYLRKFTPESLTRAYHLARAFVAVALNGAPAKKLLVIGITGTKGKTSVANYVWSVLQAGGIKTGLISSANFRIGDKEDPNPFHMTMPNPFIIQSKMREMRKQGVTAVVMEMTSEGMKQFRHVGIPVDFAVFTNLTPEHLASHKNDFEVYKRAKRGLFKALSHPQKTILGNKIPRTIIANADSEHAPFYLKYKADKKITFGFNNGDIKATNIESDITGTSFTTLGEHFKLSIPGTFNVYNALPALIAGDILGISHEDIRTGLSTLGVIPGRMEMIDEGQDFTTIVDYAHEPASLGALLSSAETILNGTGKIILLTGGQGGGRDPRKREPMAKLAAQKADFVIVSNEDPYDDDPEKIVNDISDMIAAHGKKKGTDLFPILDRALGIRKAFSLASRGDIVLITGKGAEQSIMVLHGGSIPWNERQMVRKILKTFMLVHPDHKK